MQEGTIAFRLLGKSGDVTQGGIKLIATYLDGVIDVRLTGARDNEVKFFEPCHAPPVQLGVTWTEAEAKLYLDGQEAASQELN